MQIKVLLFASLRDLVGSEKIEVELEEGASVKDLIGAISVKYPILGERLPSTRVAVDDRFSTESDPIEANSEVALIPPVSGG
ncbi:MAG: MoaD/ThiS family protein [Planctomycetota bacterium]|nr:MoaD/ThiS family protein [Planctomycetota bacterium]